MADKILIFTHGGSRLGNQLFNSAALYSLYKRYSGKVNIINLSFAKYANLFELDNCCWANRNFCLKAGKYIELYAGSGEMIQRLIKFLIHLFGYIVPGAVSVITKKDSTVHRFIPGRDIGSVDSFSHSRLNQLVEKNRIIILAGWHFNDWELTGIYAGQIRSRLRFKEEYYTKVKDFIDFAKKGCDILTGVLMRQTDYRYWRQGRYFFDSPKYADFMRQFREKFTGKTVRFLIASEEEQEPGNFRELDYIFAPGQKTGRGHYIENMIALSLCDYIMSPVSTFSQWAGFMGGAEFLLLCSVSQDIAGTPLVKNNILNLDAQTICKRN